MNEMLAQLSQLKRTPRGYWAERITAELEYAACLSKVQGRQHDALLRSTIASTLAQAEELGAITRELVEETESRLNPLAGHAKSYRLLCAAHAHIDMNWLWRYDETVSVTLETFRTMLDLMVEYPSFTFSQSQASVYRIVEEHDPELLKEIRKRVKEGRWEVTASTWVETDKNMPSGESLSRHVLYTRRYLQRLFDLEPEAVRIDFEPDTFGHSRNVPEIMSRGGVRYYYHCRGFEEHNLYRWRSPSGAELLVYRDPFWYNAEVSTAMAAPVVDFCHRHGMDTMLRSYGVGDHGGGPTRRDIERILDMDRWPIFPRVSFGTFAEYFALAEKVAEKLPVVDRELNPVFTGCYTTQTRIKAANRAAERRLAEAEAFSAMAALAAGHHYRSDAFGRAWEKVLFNHFHDILPGSGIVDTREFALGQFQQALACAATEQTLALRRIASRIDTAGLGCQEQAGSSSMSEGAGVGWGIESFGLARVERGRGMKRIFHLFNPSPRPRTAVTELVVWDWEGDPQRIVIRDENGEPLQHQTVEAGPMLFFAPAQYWGHQYRRILVKSSVPALGYATCALSEAVPSEVPIHLPLDPRVERPDSFVLENEKLRAEFDTVTCALVSLVEKGGGEELLASGRPAGVFRYVEEDDAKGMAAWIVGRWASERCLHDGVKVSARGLVKGKLRQWLSYEIAFKASKLRATVSLDEGSAILRWSVECDWLEIGRKGATIPQLNFHLPLAGDHKAYRYDVPFGTVDRAAAAQDLPANSWVAAIPRKAGHRGAGSTAREAPTVMLVAGQKHGFRCENDSLSLTLIRSAYDPDPYPELGVHRFDFGVAVSEGASNASLISTASEYSHPFSVLSTTAHEGSLPRSGSLLSLEGGTVVLSALKLAEEGGKRLVARLYETEGKETSAILRLLAPVSRAWFADLMERPLEEAPRIAIDGTAVKAPIAPHTVATIVMELS